MEARSASGQRKTRNEIPVSSVQFLIGKTLGKYEVLEHVGHGGMSEVYKGQQAQLYRLVAIKVMHPFLADDEGFVARFQREARIVATLRHPNIVQVYDFDHNDELDLYYMVMEFIDGPTLKDRLLEGPLEPEETVHIGAAIASALDYAHQRGMVHRDIKPANILFIDSKEPVLTDFGIAHMVTLSGLTASGAMVGTPAYMAPEIGKGKPGTALSDIYSLCVLLYQCVTGTLPFTADSPMGMVLAHVNSAPLPPQQINPSIPEGLSAVILRGLAKEPEARFATAGELAAALRVSLDAGAQAEAAEEARAGSPPGTLATSAPLLSAPGPGQRVSTGETPVPSVVVVTPPDAVPPPETDALDEARLVKSWNPLSHRKVIPESTDAAVEDVPLRSSWLLTGGMLGIALLAIVWATWIAIGGGTSLAAHERPIAGMVAGARDVLRRPTSTPTVASAIAQLPFATTAAAAPSPAPTLDCALRVRADRIRIDPAAVVAPEAALVARITVYNSGNCTWPEGVGLHLTDGPALGGSEVLTATALNPDESIQWILPLVAPEATGSYTSAWQMQRADGTPFGSRILLAITVEDVTPLPPTATFLPPTPTMTPVPLALEEVTLLDWQDNNSRGTWLGTAQIVASGGSGEYRYFVKTVLPDNEIAGGVLAFEGRHCE
ncbi:MAG: protein kinase, partial [Acidobacteriota bacterium]|nr:protein kinase [Acidobacteriota bacterium]